MDWFKAFMIFIMISFSGVLVYVYATLENLITEYGNLKAQIETLKNGHSEATNIITDIFDKQDAITELVNNGFRKTLGICNSVLDLWNKFNSRLNSIEDAMENRAKESSEVFEAVRNDINEIRGDMAVLKANCSAPDVRFKTKKMTDLEVETDDQK